MQCSIALCRNRPLRGVSLAGLMFSLILLLLPLPAGPHCSR